MRYSRRRIFSWSRMLMALSLLMPMMARADKETVNGIEWNYTVKDGKAEIFSVDSVTTETMRIPSTLGGHPVISVSDLAFRNGRTRYVIMPASVEEFGFGAGPLNPKGCEVVSFVVDEANPWYCSTNGQVCTKDGKDLVLGVNGDALIPSGVTNIGGYAFYKRDGLRSVSIPNSVLHIEPCAFLGCNKVISFTVDARNEKYSSISGMLCTKDGQTIIHGVNADVMIPTGIKRIGSGAFYGRRNVTSVTIPKSVVEIEKNAFAHCKGLSSLTLPSTLTNIDARAFSDCPNLRAVTVLRDGRVDDMSIAEFLKQFEKATRERIQKGRAEQRQKLRMMARANKETVNGIEWNYTVKDGKAEIFSVDSVTTETMRIPSTLGGHPVISVSDLAFRNGRTRYVIMPASVEEFGLGAKLRLRLNKPAHKGCEVVSFVVDEANPWYCSTNGLVCTKDGKNLVSGVNGDVIIPSCVTNVGRYAFYKRDGLRSVSIPNSVQHIGKCAFSGCRKLASVKIPDGVKEIEDGAFSGCSGLASVTFPDSILVIGRNGKTGLLSRSTGAFSGCCALTSITIPSNVVSIGQSAFNGCSALASVTIPSNVNTIGHSAFRGCCGIKRVTMPPSVMSIGEHAFSDCKGLEAVLISQNVTNIGYNAFADCSELTRVTISETLISTNSCVFIDSRAFTKCHKLKTVDILHDGKVQSMPLVDFMKRFEKTTKERIQKERAEQRQELQKIQEELRRARESRRP